MENQFKYKVTVIVPVYNVEIYLRACLDSLLAQTMDHEQMEVLLINDGSTDGSLEICQEYTELFPMFKVFSKENEGLSATRNYGIERASGKYLMYLDSDDMFTPETVKAITDFFDTVYDEVDLVEYRIQPYKNKTKLATHSRYKWLTKSGVYDLDKYPYVCQTTINVCVKNFGKQNHLFDTTPNFRHEDQEYNNFILARKRKIGYCDKGEYQYMRNDNSIMSVYMYPLYIFETTMNYYEKLFASYDEVPKYYQAMFAHDISWKLKGSVLFPYHYEGEEYDNAIRRLTALIDRVDDEIIMTSPSMNAFHSHFFLNMKSDASKATVYAKNGLIEVIKENRLLLSVSKFELIMHKIYVKNGQLKMRAFLKTPLYSYMSDKARIYVIENNDITSRKLLDVNYSIHSYYNSKDFTNKFYSFIYHCSTEAVRNFKFVVELDGIIYPTKFWCMPVAVFSNNNEGIIKSYIRDKVLLTLKNNEVFLEQYEDAEIMKFELQQTEKYKNNLQIYNLRRSSLNYRVNHNVWLYYDLYTVKKDNGYYQFINDFCHKDGVERYYVYNCDLQEIEEQFTEEQKGFLVKFGSQKHKLLYLSARKVFTAFFGFSPISPFGSEKEEGNYIDIIKFETIYLQHGVLHADLKIVNHAERSRVNKIVVSSYFERDNYINNYGYEEDEIVCTGMARYDHIDRALKPKNRILFAPSWRHYLTVQEGGSEWKLLKSRIIQTDYYSNINEFINNPRLSEILEKNNLYLDFKLHPIIKDAKELFAPLSDRVNMVSGDVEIEDYDLFITDFSSFVFDFAYLSRPIAYFVPDMIQFKSGMNHYRKLDLPWEKAFGRLTTDPNSAVDEVIRIVNNNFIPDPVYKDRMDHFYFPLENCCEKLYQNLTQNDGR